uniref:Fibrinogen C-terminal domain-containing protein n=1 Tax=Anopheles atroparvus TaxID=41427 RepID=A0AAG5DLB1_ANOAO
MLLIHLLFVASYFRNMYVHPTWNDLSYNYDSLVKQVAEAINNLRNTSEKLLEAKIEILKQLTNVENAAYHQSGKDVFPSSCKTPNIKEAGIYSIRPAGVVEPFLVLCEFKNNLKLGGGWTVFQRRFNGRVNFYRNWTMYKNGFGDVNGEHWLGLEKLHAMTRSGRHEMLVVLEDHDGYGRYALYESFRIGSEAEKYKLTIGNYSGTAGDSLSCSNGANFSTFDQDNDKTSGFNCAQQYHGVWCLFFYFNCRNLNGQYRRKGEHINYSPAGVFWKYWKSYYYSMKSTKMMFRPRSGMQEALHSPCTDFCTNACFFFGHR